MTTTISLPRFLSEKNETPLSNTGSKRKKTPAGVQAEKAENLLDCGEEEKNGDENYTPSSFIEICREFLGSIDLDVFSCTLANKVVKAKKFYTKEDSAIDRDLSKYKKKFANPPYSRGLVDKCVDHVLTYVGIGETLLLVNTDPSVKWYQRARDSSAAYLFPSERMQFFSPFRDPLDKKKRNRYAQTLFYFGDRPQEFAEKFLHLGQIGFPYKIKTSEPLPDYSELEIKYAGGIDWIQGVLPNISEKELSCIKCELQAIFKDSFDTKDLAKFSGRQFSHGIKSARSAHIAWNDIPNQPNRKDVWISLPSKFLQGCDKTYLLLRFMRQITSLMFRPTRIDLYLDDYTKSLSFLNIEAAYDANLHHGFDDLIEYRKKKKAIHAGRTLYLGSPQADKMVRIYEKFLESHGEVDAIRLEAQLKDNYCNDAWGFLLRSNEETLSQTAVNIAINCIDFYQGDRKNKKRVDWWQKTHDLVNATHIKITCGRLKNSIERSMEWIQHGGVARALATVRNYYGHTTNDFYEWLDSMLDFGQTKQKTCHEAQILEALSLQDIPDWLTRELQLEGCF